MGITEVRVVVCFYCFNQISQEGGEEKEKEGAFLLLLISISRKRKRRE